MLRAQLISVRNAKFNECEFWTFRATGKNYEAWKNAIIRQHCQLKKGLCRLFIGLKSLTAFLTFVQRSHYLPTNHKQPKIEPTIMMSSAEIQFLAFFLFSCFHIKECLKTKEQKCINMRRTCSNSSFCRKNLFAQLHNQFDFGCYCDWKSIGFIGEVFKIMSFRTSEIALTESNNNRCRSSSPLFVQLK